MVFPEVWPEHWFPHAGTQNDDTDKQMTGLLIIIKQPERFIKLSASPHSMNKLTLNEPAKL